MTHAGRPFEAARAMMLWPWRAYLRPRAWEADGRVYEALAVRHVKEFFFGGRHMNALVSVVRGRRYRPFRGPGWPQRWLWFTVVVELGHACAGLFLVAYAVAALARGDLPSASIAAAVNLVSNVNPVMVQRYNRARLVRIFGPPRVFAGEATGAMAGAPRLIRCPDPASDRIASGCSRR